MAQIRLSIATVNITNDLIVIARKTTTPLVIEAQEVYNAPHPTTRNVVLPASGDIDPVIYYVDFYESSNGVSLDLLLASFQYDLKNNIIIFERRFYVVNGPALTDPAPNQKILSDVYLDGKTITGFFKTGYGYLRPNTEPVIEWVPYAGGGIELQDPLQFSDGEVYCVEISYLTAQTQVGGGGLYSGVELIDTTMTLNSSYRNKRLRCESAGSNILVVTLEALASVPDGTFYHFTSNGGNQNQTRILPDGSETIKYNGENYEEMSFGKGEFLRIVKVGSFWEAELAHHNILQVGERFSGTWKDHPSCKPEEASILYDGDEWPRIWWWIKNKLPITHYIADDNVINVGYTHPANRVGQFVIHSTLKKFRLPNTQNLSERGLKFFLAYGIDSDRLYDYPGGVQDEMVGPHSHYTTIQHGHSYSGGPNRLTVGNGLNSPEDFDYLSQDNDGFENRVKNFGVIYMRRF
jgi:hypothetical protein